MYINEQWERASPHSIGILRMDQTMHAYVAVTGRKRTLFRLHENQVFRVDSRHWAWSTHISIANAIARSRDAVLIVKLHPIGRSFTYTFCNVSKNRLARSRRRAVRFLRRGFDACLWPWRAKNNGESNQGKAKALKRLNDAVIPVSYLR